MFRRYANCREGQIHLREAGPADGPVLAFFHQTASSGAMFEQVMRRLADRYRCLSFDSPGFGGSYQPAEIPDIRFLGDRLLEALDDLGVDRFHACGHHTGGCVALEMAVARRPGAIAHHRRPGGRDRRGKGRIRRRDAGRPRLDMTVAAGHRPALPDTVPVRSAPTATKGVFSATRHGHPDPIHAAKTARPTGDPVTRRPTVSTGSGRTA